MTNPFANPSVLTNLIKDMDELQLKRRPLQPHAISALSKTQKQLYITMLVAILINQNISKAQSRLLTMLLDSMSLNSKPAQLYDEVTLLGKAELQTFCELCDEHALAPCFLMDVLVLCRLDTSLNHDQQRSIAELVSLLAIPEHTLSDILHLANEVISPQPLDLTFDEDNLDYGDKLYIEFDYNLLKPWHEFSYQPLSVDNLQHELTGGKWLAKNVLELNHDCKISNAKIVFGDKAKLTVNLDGQGDGLKISNSYLESAAILVNNHTCSIDNTLVEDGCFTFKNCSIELLDSKFFNKESRFLEPLINSDSILKIDNCFFQTENRSAIKVEYLKSIEINNSKFVSCGFVSKEKSSGAIFIEVCHGFKCINSEFIDNLSNYGKDIYIGSARGIYSIKECTFVNGNDVSWNASINRDTSIHFNYLEHFNTDRFEISKCSFISTKTYINSTGRYRRLINDSTFKNSPVYSNIEENYLFESCDFDNNGKPNLVKIED